MRWLIVLDGTDRTKNAAVFARGLVTKEDEVLFLSTGEAGLGLSAGLYEGIHTTHAHRPGSIPEVLEAFTRREAIDIVVYGSRGRRGVSRLLLGSVAAYLEHHLNCSLLVFRGEIRPVRKILVASGLYESQTRAVDIGGKLATRLRAAVTILHVMSQVPLAEDAMVNPLEADAQEAIAQGTREGKLIRGRLNRLESLGLSPNAVLRHGLVIDEIRAELKDGGYDLLIAGGHRVPEDLPFGTFLTRDMADEILMNTPGAVLIA